MKVRTLDELSSFLREDLAWRRKENLCLQSAVRAAEASKRQAFLRAAVAVLYAHWEGFVKSACRSYLDFVAMRRLTNAELCVEILGLSFRFRMSKVVESSRLDSHSEFAVWLLKEWHSRARLPKSDDIISTSNLFPTVFKSFIKGLGLPYYPEYEIAEKPVIESLVTLRNSLAHGEWHQVDEGQYDSFHMWIDRLMNTICDSVENAASLGQYKRPLVQLV